MLRTLRPFVLTLCALLFTLVTVTVSAQNQALEPIDLRVMTFNIWVGGELVDFGKVIEAIQLADADVVGLQEPGGNAARIAAALGWQHVSERLHIISRYPLIDPPDGNGVYIYVQVRPGEVVALANTHLPSDPYGPYLLRDGESLEAVLENERVTRLESDFFQSLVTTLPGVVEAGYPLVLTGDFNAPSHLDWTDAMVGVVPHIPFAVEWQVSRTLEELGFIDSYRAIYPDPTARVGMTWTPGYPVPRLREGEVVDRIDYVYAAGNVQVLDSQIVGELGGADVDIAVDPYPSDHRGVVSTLRITPAVPPLFAAVTDRVITQGDDIVVRYAAPEGENTDRIVIVPAGGGVPNDNLLSLPPMEADFFGAVTFGSQTLAPGEYAAVLVGGGETELSRSQFWILAPDAVPEIRTTQPTFAPDEPISIEWANAPDNRYDWIGIYLAGESDLYNYYAFVYTNSASSGSTAMVDAALEPGDYEVRLMRDDWYVVLASAAFTVSAP
ncbi:MAG: endonuclease/exonuclease/phosphatase family protein [Chloroflexota bacterium]|nr:endonuclease/exonuclease/phosphatase family protein [Chloroflexota bacterium]